MADVRVGGLDAHGSLIPFSEPSEPVEYEHTTVGRISCLACGEWMYPRRKAGTLGPFAFAPECEVCAAPVSEDE